jgi:hypothetical protein
MCINLPNFLVTTCNFTLLPITPLTMLLTIPILQSRNHRRTTKNNDIHTFLFFTIPTPIYAACWLFGGALIRPSAKIVRLIGDFNALCSLGGSDFNVHVCVLVRSWLQSLRSACVCHTGDATGSEVGSMKKEVWSDARNNRSAAIPAPCAGAICNFLLPTFTFILPTSMQGARTLHGMTRGVGFWRRYCC